MAIQRRIRGIWLVLILALSITNCTFNDTSSQLVEPIEGLYKKNCSLCHGMNGKLGTAGAGDLTKSVISHEEIVQIITHGKPENPGKIMTPFKDVLSVEEIDAMATFVKGFRTQ